MPKPTAQAMRAVQRLFPNLRKHQQRELALGFDEETRLPALIEALTNLVARSQEVSIDMNRYGSMAHYFEHASFPHGLLGAREGAMENARAALQDAEGGSDE